MQPTGLHPSEPGRGARGFTLIELLAALAVTGLLVVMLGQAMDRIVANSAAVLQSAGYPEEIVSLRRLLHRDLQSMTNVDTFRAERDGFALETTHNLFTSQPLPVSVSWRFSGIEIRRTESIEQMQYEKSMTLHSGLRSWDLAMYVVGEDKWVSLQSWRLSEGLVPQRTNNLNALRLGLEVEGAAKVDMVEWLGKELALPLQ